MPVLNPILSQMIAAGVVNQARWQLYFDGNSSLVMPFIWSINSNTGFIEFSGVLSTDATPNFYALFCDSDENNSVCYFVKNGGSYYLRFRDNAAYAKDFMTLTISPGEHFTVRYEQISRNLVICTLVKNGVETTESYGLGDRSFYYDIGMIANSTSIYPFVGFLEKINFNNEIILNLNKNTGASVFDNNGAEYQIVNYQQSLWERV